MSQLNLAGLGLDLDVAEDKVVKSDRAPLPAGTYGARLVGVVELGKHEGFDKTKVSSKVMLVFQMFGKLVPETKDKDGNVIPTLDFLRLNKSFHEKGTYLPVFNRLNYEGKAKNMFQLLGTALRVKRTEYDKTDGTKGIKIKPEGLLSPMVEVLDDDGMPTGEVKMARIPEATADIMVYQWAHGTQQQFDTLMPFMQKEIASALDFAGSPADGLTFKEGDTLDADAEVAPKPSTKATKASAPADDSEEVDF